MYGSPRVGASSRKYSFIFNSFFSANQEKKKTEYMWYPVSIGTNQVPWLVGNKVSLAHYFYFFFFKEWFAHIFLPSLSAGSNK